MYLLTNLEEQVLNIPYKLGYRRLRILTGYASSPFLMHVLDHYPDIELELIIGMASKDGVQIWDHTMFQEIVENNTRITIKYQMELPGIHTKIYHWYGNINNKSITFIGSANFSWNGFRDQRELLCKVNYKNINDVFEVTNVINCTDQNVEYYINLHSIEIQRRFNNSAEDIQLNLNLATENYFETISLHDLEYVDLKLLLKKDTEIHERSGLNWGQREGREPNQAYIPVPTTFNRVNPNFFPPLEQAFTMLTDDGQQLICKMAQQNRKAIHTTENNSIMGRYFRDRLGVPFGERVDVTDVLSYGRTSVRIFKINSETFFMDFGT